MPPDLGAVLSYWPFEPAVLVGVAIAAMLYAVGGVVPRKRHTGSLVRWREVAFWLGLLTILLALQSPIEMLARQLFWMHMVQHLLLTVVAAPLLAIASPWTRLWRALPLAWRRSVAKPVFLHPSLASLRSAYHQVSRPGVIWTLAAANLWLWHLPALYDLTLRNHFVHHLEHGLFLGLGGGMMWVPGAVTYSIVFIVLLFQWLAEEDMRAAALGKGQAHGG